MALNKRVRRRLILLCVLVFVLVVTVVAGYFFTKWSRNRQVDVAASEGMAAYLDGDYITALPKLSKAVTYKKEDLDLALALGHTRLRNIDVNGRHISASEKYFLHALSLDRENEEALRELVKIYVATGDTTDALTYSDRLPHDDIEIIKSRASVLRSVGRIDDALAEIDRIRLLSPNDSNWPLYEFTLRRERGDDPESMLGTLNEYEQSHPNNQALALTKASLLRSTGKIDESSRIARDLSNLPEIDPAIIIQLQQQLEMLEMNVEAEAILVRAGILAGEDPEIARALTDRLWRRSEYEAALDLSLEAYEAYPEELDFLRMAAAFATFVLDEEATQEIHQKLLVDSRADDTARAKVDEAVVAAYKSQSAATIKELQASLSLVRNARSLDSRNLNLMLMEASNLQRTGQSDAAMNIYRELFMVSGSRAAGRQLASLLLQTQQHQNALIQSERLFRFYPSLDSYMIRARAWIALKRSGTDPFALSGQSKGGIGITSRIRDTYEKTRERSGEAATPLLPLIAGAASLEDERESLEFAIDQALLQDDVPPEILLQIVAINDSLGGPRSEELLQRATKNGASAFDIAFSMAERARNLGEEEAALAILKDVRSRNDFLGAQRNLVLKQTLAFMASSPSSDQLLEEMSKIFDELPEDHEAARIISSYPGIWISSPELGQSALERIDLLLGKESTTYIVAEARQVISTKIDDDASRANSIVALNGVIRRSPESVVAMLVLSDLLRMGSNPDYSGAANYLRKALETRPDQISLYPTIIQLHQKIGDRDRAIEYLERYQKIAPNMNAARNRVSLYVKQGLTKEAILELKGIAAESNSPLDRISLALFLAREGMIDEALEQYDLGLDLDAENRFAFDGKLILLATVGRVEEALEIARKSEMLDARRLMTLEIELFLASGNLEAANQTSNELLAQFPESIGTWIILARVRSQLNDLPGARNALRQALMLDPENVIALGQLLPLLVADTNSWEEARSLLPRLKNDAPTLADVLELKMDSSDPVSGTFKPQADDLARSLQLVVNYPETVAPRHLAWTMHSIAGDHQGALRIAREAMINLPSDPNPALWGYESAVNLQEWDTALDLAVSGRDRSPSGRRLEHDMRIAELSLNMGRYGVALDALLPYEDLIADDEMIYAQLPTAKRLKDKEARLPKKFRKLLLKALLLSGRLDDAEIQFMSILQQDPELLFVWTSLIQGMEPSIGRDALQRVSPLLVDKPEKRLALGNNWLQLAKKSDNPEDAEMATRIIDELLAEEPMLLRKAMLCKAQLTEHVGDIEESNRIYRELVELFTVDELASFKTVQNLKGQERINTLDLIQVYLTTLNNLAFQLKELEADDLKEAIVRINDAISIAPLGIQPELMDTKAQIFMAGGNDASALVVIEKAIQMAPTRLDLRIQAIKILIRLERIDQASMLAQQSFALTNQYRYKKELVDQLRALIEKIG
jgi:tetratricopeptide (TPR) repeat protein